MIALLLTLILFVLLFFLNDIASNLDKQTIVIHNIATDLKLSLEQLEAIKDSIIYMHPDISEINRFLNNDQTNKNHNETIQVLCEISSEISSTKDKIEMLYLSR